MTRSCDILVVADPRFSGGSATALLADVAAFQDLGARLGFAFIESKFFEGAPDQPNEALLDLVEQNDALIVRDGDAVRADVAFLHHPLPFNAGIRERISIHADRSVLVAHHPPFRGDGSLEYNPLRVNRRIKSAFGIRPLWAPVSGLIRQQLRSFAPLLRLTSEDWINVFDPSDWNASRLPFSDPSIPIVGRHSRPDPLKWPDDPGTIRQSLGNLSDWHVRVMGCPTSLQTALPEKAECLLFNEEPVTAFLNKLDVFVFHYSNRWVEAFGRTVIEAMLMGRPCVLDPRLKGTFGDLADYTQPQDVAVALHQLRDNREATRKRVASVREIVASRYSADAVASRLANVRADNGSLSRIGAKAAPPMTTLRKTFGLLRRQATGAES